MTSDDELLRTHCPLLRLDSHETFPPCSPEAFVSSPRVTLKRANGEPIAWAPELSLAFLGANRYANGDRAASDDVLGHDGKTYAGTLQAMLRDHPDFADVIYGRVHRAPGDVGEWLQFWIFYLWNGGLSRHEGDWEYLQLRRVEGRIVAAIAAQHRTAELRPFDKVEQRDRRPVFYVARGTHATLFEPGRHGLDVCDGRGRLVDPRLEVMPETGWPLCRVRVGDTRGDPDRPWETTSPPMPGRTLQWRDPEAWAARAT